MGNVNEKNASTNEEKDIRRSLLEPVKHPDPWTVCMRHFLQFLMPIESIDTLG
jgi:hypothetical protein